MHLSFFCDKISAYINVNIYVYISVNRGVNKLRVIIVGSGIAALSFIRALKSDIEVICVTKDRLSQNNSYFAQGGICFSKYEEDQGEQHARDTFEAGAQMGDLHMLKTVIQQSYPLIEQLIDEGLPFDRDEMQQLLYGMEGAHQLPRILHAGGDQTGYFIAQHMVHHLSHPRLTIYEAMEVIDLVKNSRNEVCGVLAIDENQIQRTIEADAVVFASGGVSNVFTTHSNVSESVATGAVIALRHQLTLESMEMIQFHPTLLGTPDQAYGLVSEAVRGAGGVLINDENVAFMDDIHPMKSLAPRDVTSRAIFQQQQQGHQCYIDISEVAHFEQRFPTIFKAIQRDMPQALAEKRIPITPGAHYTVGGIQANIHGQTQIENVFAIGEAACTNFHGANRLASNSLLEGLVMGANCAEVINQHLVHVNWEPQEQVCHIPIIQRQHVQKIQQYSFEVLGVEREQKAMAHYLQMIETLLDDAPQTSTVTHETWQNYSILKLLQTICHSALRREESRGVHYRKDYPTRETEWQDKVIEMNRGGQEHVESVVRQRKNKSILH